MADENERQYSASRKRFATNVAAQYGLQIAKYLIPFVTLPYLARVLGDDGYGIRAYILSVMTIVNSVLDFGFMTSATKSVSRARDDNEKVARTIGAVLQGKAILLVAVAAALVPIGAGIPLLRENPHYTVIAFVAAALNSLVPDFVFMGYERMSVMTVRYVVSKTVGLLLTFALVRSPDDLLIVPAIDVVTSGIAVVWTFAGMRRRFGVKVKLAPLRQSWEELKSSSVVFVANFSTTLFNSYTTLVIGVIFNASEVAIWSLATTVVSVVQSLYSPIFNSLYVYMVSQLDVSHFKKIVVRGVVLAAILSVGVAVCGRPIMWVMGGEGYLYGSYLIALVSPVIFLSFFSIALGWPLLGAFGFEKNVTASTLFSGVFTLVAVSAVGLSGFHSLALFAFVRCASEMALVLGRVGAAWKRRKDILRISATRLADLDRGRRK
ncbi:oligosaccharide flippase family protein [Rubneribacter badeniensis]|uniref:oligosaccharide flippase family protein n=1 Tax=Rubneribacter badeniensis TaxID=2070688 RepID=UPI003A93678E